MGRGLSPRVRGNQACREGRPVRRRSIPAGAGEPISSSVIGNRVRVYPRGCGGTPRNAARVPATRGLSPRVRGNLDGLHHQRPGRGSIPAGAGEPPRRVGSTRSSRVYPRGCGGTVSASRAASPSRGLSPRVRGNPHDHVRTAVRAGSIPAGAGEPNEQIASGQYEGVYPRGCGGTTCQRPCSPGWQRSIPAGAGNHHPPERGSLRGWVYPPRVRGNR